MTERLKRPRHGQLEILPELALAAFAKRNRPVAPVDEDGAIEPVPHSGEVAVRQLHGEARDILVLDKGGDERPVGIFMLDRAEP